VVTTSGVFGKLHVARDRYTVALRICPDGVNPSQRDPIEHVNVRLLQWRA